MKKYYLVTLNIRSESNIAESSNKTQVISIELVDYFAELKSWGINTKLVSVLFCQEIDQETFFKFSTVL